MKMITAVAVAIGLGALGACNQSAQEQAADNIEANAENTADMIEANADTAAENLEANAENTADAVRAAGEIAADATRNSADADGNSTNYSLTTGPPARRWPWRKGARSPGALFPFISASPGGRSSIVRRPGNGETG